MVKKAISPAQVHEFFSADFSGGDIDSLVALYEENATLVPQPGESVSGRVEIRQALLVFLELRGSFEMKPARVFESGDTALLISPWSLEGGVDPAGNNVNLSGITSDVVRRQSDGRWLLVIDNPWGAAGVEQEILQLIA